MDKVSFQVEQKITAHIIISSYSDENLLEYGNVLLECASKLKSIKDRHQP